MFDSIHEECGVFGIYDTTGKIDVARNTYYALYALQHRGQEGCGIAVMNDGQLIHYRDRGLVGDVFNDLTLNELRGQSAIGHVLYGAAGEGGSRENIQPLVSHYQKGAFALANNGSLVNADELRQNLANQGAIFRSSSDGEVIAQLIAKERIHCQSTTEALLCVMKLLRGAYSLVIMTPLRMIAARDPQGFRPLCIGRLDGQYVFASETCALDAIGAEFVREVEPGEVVTVDADGFHSNKEMCGQKTSLCVFEYVYFARPDSEVEGESVHVARQNAGRALAKESPVEADLVIGVPDSGLDAAIGYSKESGVPYGIGFLKNKYIGRTFIQPTQDERETALRIKLNAIRGAVAGKRVIMIDDSIVRGTTMRRIVNLLREAGATEVHVRISSPPFINICYFGTDIGSRKNLIACRMSHDEICKEIGADSLAYLSIESMQNIVTPKTGIKFCDACFTGNYPIEVPAEEE